eukprot:TRINITY_DN2085_c0_g1_i1.p1 TRINITY_DN2085_c0_g1~~TRINITY_DN2085_c0_g1_i1.p1  ORF type:complete len:295 (+),score=56.72 TRINITY_DN2085_c0_g1_i1:1516-2400(+)
MNGTAPIPEAADSTESSLGATGGPLKTSAEGSAEQLQSEEGLAADAAKASDVPTPIPTNAGNVSKGQTEGKKGKKGLKAPETGGIGLFPEFEVVVEEETFDADKRRREDEKLMAKFTGMQIEEAGADASLSQKELDAATGLSETRGYQGKKDPLSLLFLSRVREAGTQVLRYDRGGKPLWCCTKGLPRPSSAEDVSPCASCGAQRTFEFQVMPQLLHYLRAEEANASWDRSDNLKGGGAPVHPALKAGLDWGVLAVYTCPHSCGEGGGYTEEVVWRQGPMDGAYVDSDSDEEED